MKQYLILLNFLFIIFSINAQWWENAVEVNFGINVIYGGSVAIDGEFAVIGAPKYNQNSGCAFIYKYDGSTWNKLGKLTASLNSIDDSFGQEVCISDEIIAVGAPNYNSSIQGKVYIYKKPDSGWTDMTESLFIQASDGNGVDHFGISIDIDNNLLTVGSSNNSVYLFETSNNSWLDLEEVTRITPDSEKKNFGKKSIISGNHLYVLSDKSVDVFKNSENELNSFFKTAELQIQNSSSDLVDFDLYNSYLFVTAGTLPESCDGDLVYVFKKGTNEWTDTEEDIILECHEIGNSTQFNSINNFSDSIISNTANKSNLWESCPYNYIASSIKLILLSKVSCMWGLGCQGHVYAIESKTGDWINDEITVSEIVEPTIQPDGQTEFGRSMAISENNIVIGNSRNSAYFFKSDYKLAISNKPQKEIKAFFYNEDINMQIYQENLSPLSVNIYNISGQQIMTQTINTTNHSIDVSNLSKGYYIISVSDATGNLVGSQSVIVY